MIPISLPALVNHLWQSTLFAAAAGLLTAAFRKNRAGVRHSLWLAASIKFLIPFSLLVGIGNHLDWRTAPAAAPAQLSFIAPIGQPFVPLAAPHRSGSPRPHPSRTPPVLLALWFCGFATGVLSWLNRWRRIRAVLRAASPLPLNLPIPVMSSPARMEPGVFGIRRPVLLLPEGITGQLTPVQLDAILAHELCHVRRRDNLTAAIHMLVEALFWFHPPVWWLEKRLVEERERACDEEVLRTIGKPEVYAEGILNVCKLYVESPLACVSGITGSGLKQRIEAIMTHRVAHQLNFGKKLLLAAAGMAAVGGPIFVGLLNAPEIRAQEQSEKAVAFEVASVKASQNADRRSFGNITANPGGRLTIVGTPLCLIIAAAYHVSIQSPRLSGQPDWTCTERFDIDATAEKGAIPEELPAKERDARMRSMLQTLLRDRFKLVVRRETKEIPVYALVVGKNGPKLRTSKTDEKDCADPRLTPVPTPPSTDHDTKTVCHAFMGGQGRGIHGTAVNMADVAGFVENWTDRPMLDETGVHGLYDIDSEGWVPLRPRPARDPGAPPSAEDLAMGDPAIPTLFTVFDRMGLKMEQKKARVEVFVIEHVERPAGN